MSQPNPDVPRWLNSSKRQATTRVGVSPLFNDLTDTAQALRYARVALNTRSSSSGGVTVFEDSLLAVAAVSAPEVTNKVAAVIFSQFDDLSSDEKALLLETFGVWLAQKGSTADAAAQLYCPSQYRPAPPAPHRRAHRAFARGA